MKVRQEDLNILMRCAVASGDYKKVVYLLEQGANPNALSAYSSFWPPLMEAAAGGNVCIATLLITHGADVNAIDGDGDTPLHLAVRQYQLESVRLLLTNNADIDIQNNNGFTPLHEAAHLRDADAISILIKAGANPTLRNKAKETPMDMCNNNDLVLDEIEELRKYTDSWLTKKEKAKITLKRGESVDPSIDSDVDLR